MQTCNRIIQKIYLRKCYVGYICRYICLLVKISYMQGSGNNIGQACSIWISLYKSVIRHQERILEEFLYKLFY